MKFFSAIRKKIHKKSISEKLGSVIFNALSKRAVKWSIFAVFIILILPGMFFYFNRPQVQGDVQYGVNFSNRYATELGLNWQDAYIKILDDLNVDNIRLVAYWDEIEPSRDSYDYSNLDWQMQEARVRNVNVILAVGKKVPRWPECFEPLWWQAISDETTRETELLEFVKDTVGRYKGYENIKIWQVENEPFFPFGTCSPFSESTLKKEISLVRSLDGRPILTQDSGEGGLWFRSYARADYLGISMYRKIWYDFWGIFLGRSIYFQYPLPYWSYKIKASLMGIPYEKVIVTELQAEPWGPSANNLLSDEERDMTMSVNGFLSTISYAQKAGFKSYYFWGAEWWLWEKEHQNNPFYWDTVKTLISN